MVGFVFDGISLGLLTVFILQSVKQKTSAKNLVLTNAKKVSDTKRPPYDFKMSFYKRALSIQLFGSVLKIAIATSVCFFPAGSPVHARGPASRYSGSEELQRDVAPCSAPHEGDDALLEEIRQSGKRAQKEGGEGSSGATKTR